MCHKLPPVITEAAIGIGVVAPAGAVFAIALLAGGWQGLRESRERRAQHLGARERAQQNAKLLRHQATLRRQRDIRLGRLTSDERFESHEEESVRVLTPERKSPEQG